MILEKTQRSLRSAFGLSHAGRSRILRTSCSCAASSKPFRKRGLSLASGGHGFCPTDGKNLSSRVCRSHTVAVCRTYALTRRWDFATIITPIGSFFRKSAGMCKCGALAEGNLPCASDFSLFTQIFLQSQKSLPRFERKHRRGTRKRCSVSLYKRKPRDSRGVQERLCR